MTIRVLFALGLVWTAALLVWPRTTLYVSTVAAPLIVGWIAIACANKAQSGQSRRPKAPHKPPIVQLGPGGDFRRSWPPSMPITRGKTPRNTGEDDARRVPI